MKRFILISIIFFSIFTIAFSQDNKTNQTTLKVTLYSLQSIEVNSSQKLVNLEYKTESDYANGVQLNQPDHLNLFSTGGFTVKVSVSDNNLRSVDGAIIESNGITVTPLAGTGNHLRGVVFNPVPLTNDAQTIITSKRGGVNKTFSVNYRGKGDFEYKNRIIGSPNPREFTTHVIYSIEAL